MNRGFFHYDEETGKVVHTDRPMASPPPGTTTSTKEHVSKSLRVHPSQVEQLNAELKSVNCTGSHYDPRGFLHSADRAALKRTMRKLGAVDFDSFD